jgi:hypothetical protein
MYGATIIDFALYSSDGKWESATVGGITGTTSLYHSDGAPDVVLAAEDGALHVTGTIPPLGHAGWRFVFDSCVIPFVNYGLNFSLVGGLGGAHLSLAIPTNADYPIDVRNGKGACSFRSCETIDSDCKSPVADISLGEPVSRTLPEFTGGLPESSVKDTSEILALQFELQCPGSVACAVSLTFGTLKFFTP